MVTLNQIILTKEKHMLGDKGYWLGDLPGA